MTAYILFFLASSFFAISEIGWLHSKLLRYSLVSLLIVFVALRYNLGYDWLGYERFFELTPDDWTFDTYFNQRVNLDVEPLYYIINLVFRSIGIGFQGLIIAIAIFNICSISYAFCKFDNDLFCSCWLVYIATALIPIQFNLIRQGIAASFLIFAFMGLLDCQRLKVYAFFVLGVTTHISSFAFLPFFWFGKTKLKWPFVLVSIGLSAVLFISGTRTIGALLSFIAVFFPGVFASKVLSYGNSLSSSAAAPLSLNVVALLLFHFCVLFLCYRKGKSDLHRLAGNLALLMIVLHLAFYDFPSVWNRAMSVCLVLEAPALWQIVRDWTGLANLRIAVSTLAILSTVANMVVLRRDEYNPLVPYHSYLQYVLLNDEGDGRERAVAAIRKAWTQRRPVVQPD